MKYFFDRLKQLKIVLSFFVFFIFSIGFFIFQACEREDSSNLNSVAIETVSDTSYKLEYIYEYENRVYRLSEDEKPLESVPVSEFIKHLGLNTGIFTPDKDGLASVDGKIMDYEKSHANEMAEIMIKRRSDIKEAIRIRSKMQQNAIAETCVNLTGKVTKRTDCMKFVGAFTKATKEPGHQQHGKSSHGKPSVEKKKCHDVNRSRDFNQESLCTNLKYCDWASDADPPRCVYVDFQFAECKEYNGTKRQCRLSGFCTYDENSGRCLKKHYIDEDEE